MSLKIGLCLALIAASVAAANKDDFASPGNHQAKLKPGRSEREYWVRVPTGYDGTKKLPLLLVLPAGSGANEFGDDCIKVNDKADKDGFLVAFCRSSREAGCWACYMNCDPKLEPKGSMSKVKFWEDEEAYFRAVIADLESRLAVDSSRIYMTGTSGGGLMAYRASVLLADKLAGVAIACGTFCWRNEYAQDDPPKAARPVAIIAFHGDQDKNVSYNHGANANITHWSSHECMEWWAKQNGCKPEPVKAALPKEKSLGAEVVVETWSGGKAPVALYTKVGGAHEFPKYANDLMWEFFNQNAAK